LYLCLSLLLLEVGSLGFTGKGRGLMNSVRPAFAASSSMVGKVCGVLGTHTHVGLFAFIAPSCNEGGPGICQPW
jgi:hypothetical protein